MFYYRADRAEDSEIRKRSDKVCRHVIEPVAQECGYEPIRADHISEPGIITDHIIEHIMKDPLVIVDLTGHNANVFYELAIRHATRKPTVQLIKKGEQIPFDVASIRTVQIDIYDPDGVEEGKKEIIKQIRSIEGGKKELNTPISTALSIQILSQSKNSEQRLVADLVKEMEGRTNALANLEFDEKLAVLAGDKEKTKTSDGYKFIESVKNNLRAVSHLKGWVNPEMREELIVNYIIPIIENALEKEDIIGNHTKNNALSEIIEIALEYNIETDKLKNFKRLVQHHRNL